MANYFLWLENNFILVALLAISILMLYTLFKCIQNSKPVWKVIDIVIAVVYVVSVVYITLISREQGETIVRLQLFWSYREIVENVDLFLLKQNIANIMLFVPFGILMYNFVGISTRWYHGLMAGFLASLSIELIQLVLRLGQFDVDDLINNTIGAMIGYLIAVVIHAIVKKS